MARQMLTALTDIIAIRIEASRAKILVLFNVHPARILRTDTTLADAADARENRRQDPSSYRSYVLTSSAHIPGRSLSYVTSATCRTSDVLTSAVPLAKSCRCFSP